MSVNLAIILGNVGKDPELTYTASGKAVCKLSIATTNNWVGADKQKYESTTWHNVVAWGRQAEVIKEYVFKGSQIHVIGRIENRSYEKDGQTRYISEIVLTSFSFVGSKADNAKSNKTEQPVKRDNSMDGSFGFDESSLPF